MEIPKTLWLKNHMTPERFSRCQFFDLPDFCKIALFSAFHSDATLKAPSEVTYRATGDLARSQCSLVCKCSYVPPEGWDVDFLREIGLGELVDDGCEHLGGFPGQGGSKILTAGLPVAKGLSKKAAEELGLQEGTAVGSAVIDA